MYECAHGSAKARTTLQTHCSLLHTRDSPPPPEPFGPSCFMEIHPRQVHSSGFQTERQLAHIGSHRRS
uniref:Uncharacterized protein n=1 Tax=Knipowitschia caucasica TaxID=637954 RepID=A0AAV2KIA4_KNICA